MDEATLSRIESLVVPNTGQRFVGRDFRDLLRPGVYPFMLGEIPLYVGKSKRRCPDSGPSRRRFAAIDILPARKRTGIPRTIKTLRSPHDAPTAAVATTSPTSSWLPSRFN
jgi:hypothetical protein